MSELFQLSGAGNDFLALVEPPAPPSVQQIRAWCRRGVSLGADGLFVLRRDARRGGDSTSVVMDYFNADGGAADLCVNGTRCAAQLAFHLGWAERQVRVHTPAGVLGGRRISDREIELEVPPPAAAPEPFAVEAGGQRVEGWYLLVGVPHAVVRWEDLEHAPVAALGPALRHHPRFAPAGANANFVRHPSPNQLEVRTYERGVEAETLACGTGVLASVACGVAAGRLVLPVRARTRGGFVLTVAGQAGEGGRIAHWSLAGDARVLSCLETFDAAAHELPPAPAWE